MSDAMPALRDATDPSIDGALRNWRGETDRRRAAYQERAQAHNAEQQARRAKLLRAIAGVGATFGVLAAVGYGLTLQPGEPAPVEPSFAAVVPPIEVDQGDAPLRVESSMDEEVLVEVSSDSVEPVPVEAPAEPVEVAPVAAPVVPEVALPTELSIVGEVLSWEKDDDLWIQLDYRGEPMTLRWLDAAGTEVLEATDCSNRIPGGLSRCYVGRTDERVDIALADGAQAGVWTVQGCQAGHCAEVASFEVR